MPLLQGQDYIDFLNGVDLSYISQDYRADKIFIPSKLYKTLSCGSPVLCIADKQSELSQIIKDAKAGVILKFEETKETVELINKLSENFQQVRIMREHAFRYATLKFNKGKIISEFLKSI